MIFSRNVLDHGYIRIHNTMGADRTIIRSARVSFGEEESKDPAGLINYLMRHRHTTPFEACVVSMEVKAPIFVARQWMRHRTWSFNEISGRYVQLDEEHHAPDALYLSPSNNKQGRSDTIIDDAPDGWLLAMEEHAIETFDLYRAMIDDGVAKEQARAVLPLSTYTRFIATVSLHNLLHFMRLRLDNHAQAEIRAYAEILNEFVSQWVPITHAAWANHVLGAVTFSAAAMRAIKRLVAGCEPDWRGIGEREKREILEALWINGEHNG